MLKQIKKNHIEAPERHMTPEERAAFEEKGNEVKKLLLAKAFEKLPESFKPDPSQVMHI